MTEHEPFSDDDISGLWGPEKQVAIEPAPPRRLDAPRPTAGEEGLAAVAREIQRLRSSVAALEQARTVSPADVEERVNARLDDLTQRVEALAASLATLAGHVAGSEANGAPAPAPAPGTAPPPGQAGDDARPGDLRARLNGRVDGLVHRVDALVRGLGPSSPEPARGSDPDRPVEGFGPPVV